MTGVVVALFGAGVVFVVLGLPDQRRLHGGFAAWRGRGAAVGEPSDAACRGGRILAFVVAGLMFFSACRAMSFADSTEWSRAEVRAVVAAAADTIEGKRSASASGSAALVGDAGRDAAEGVGPSYRLDVSSAGGGDRYQVAADQGGFPYCLSLVSTGSGGFAVPGAEGATDVVPEPSTGSPCPSTQAAAESHPKP
ncbi:hypothetical protein ACH414_07210 [Streptomyces sp. NPDC020422]|uniref:hypothetical protein n=1 Tax=Streptomyces sp. NPDC020422 TaxID=3365074 RepID=UPI00379CE263